MTWLDERVGFHSATANRFMAAYHMVKSSKLLDLESLEIDGSALMMLPRRPRRK
jgi:hypothetical protein